MSQNNTIYSSNTSLNIAYQNNNTIVSTFDLINPLPDVPEKMMVYKTIDPDVSEEDIISLMDTFNLQGKILNSNQLYAVIDGDKILQVYKEPGTGYLRFSDMKKLMKQSKSYNLPSENEAIQMAEDFLSSNGLLSNNTFLTGVGYNEIINWNTEGEIVADFNTAISVGFGYMIDELEVRGPGAKAGVIFGENGEIIGASKIWREIEPDKEEILLSPEEALNNFKESWPPEGDPEEADIVTMLKIKKVYLVYDTRPGFIPQSHIAPAYVFFGTYNISYKNGNISSGGEKFFEIFIPAIASNYEGLQDINDSIITKTQTPKNSPLNLLKYLKDRHNIFPLLQKILFQRLGLQ
jgi:hypothetical protein